MDLPNAATFRTGDLLWPKRKGALVPRTRGFQAAGPNPDRQNWEATRRQAMANPGAAGLSPEVAAKLASMSYEEFERIYFSATASEAPPSAPAPGATTRSLGAMRQPISLGHVALIDIDANGVVHITEATPTRPDGTPAGVVRSRYADWLRRYADIQVWHGRFRDLDAAQARRIVEVAVSQLGKPYDFFNFDLDDDRGFYCSKLIWMCVWRGAKFAVVENPDPNRGNRFPPWFAPKTLIAAKRVTLLHNPGEY
jgi:hypothetical protein